MRGQILRKYLDKYSLGVVEVENSLEQYNSFFRNMGFKERIEDLVEKRLEENVFVKIMDLGCGDGGFLAELKKIFGDSIHTIGVDILACHKAPDEMITGDALHVTFPPDLDFVFSFRSMHEIGEPEKMIEKIHSSLAKGGKAFLSIRTMDMYVGGKGIAEIGEKEIKALQKMVRSGKLKGFKVKGFEATVNDEKGGKLTAGVNVFLEK